ncbi:ATP synthase subunit K, mitochondrial [Trichomonascus vanleenenianus]|uniref:F1F0 ATP synthase subunit k n=1 Tax=Trichomonascus vanleenenianus TaxID=2268995 RepID=UPI003ECACDB5
MGAHYVIFGRVFQPYHITLATIGTLGGLIALSKLRAEKPTAPAINAGSDDEDKFIKDFIKAAEESK